MIRGSARFAGARALLILLLLCGAGWAGLRGGFGLAIAAAAAVITLLLQGAGALMCALGLLVAAETALVGIEVALLQHFDTKVGAALL